MGTLVLVGGIWSIVTAAWTLAIVIILGSALYVQALRTRTGNVRNVLLRTAGIEIDGVLTPWEHCSGFWMYRYGQDVVVHIEKIRGWEREITLPIEAARYQDIAQVIGAFLPYRAERREKLLDYIIRICKL